MILPDWFWKLRGYDMVSSFQPTHVNPTSYDLTLGREIALQVYQGQEYRDEPRVIFGDYLFSHDPSRPALPNRFLPGDSVLATTDEIVRVPRWVKLQGHLKSSLAREGLNHRSALLIDPGFEGQITLELEFAQSGKLIPDLPIIQVEANLVLPRKHYGQLAKSHYNNQIGVTVNRNPHIAFRRLPLPTEAEERELQTI